MYITRICKFVYIFAPMKTTTKAIVLNLSKYSDKASVLHTYSRDYGRMSYMVYGINGKKYRELSAATEPFSLVEIESTASVGRDMPTLSKISFDYVQQNTICDIRKRTVAVFIAEIIYRTMRHPEPDKGLFDFLASTIHELNDTTEPENYHLSFLLRYTYYLGIMPAIDETGVMLDIQTGNMRSLTSYPYLESRLSFILITMRYSSKDRCSHTDRLMKYQTGLQPFFVKRALEQARSYPYLFHAHCIWSLLLSVC